MKGVVGVTAEGLCEPADLKKTSVLMTDTHCSTPKNKSTMDKSNQTIDDLIAHLYNPNTADTHDYC